MRTFYIKRGRDIRLKGAAAKQIVQLPFPSHVAVQPQDFRGIRPRLQVKVGDAVKIGTSLIVDKDNPELKIVSPASGKIVAVNRGEKRILQEIIVETSPLQEKIVPKLFSPKHIAALTREEIIQHLLSNGLWPCIRQRPFSKIADPKNIPKAIFVKALNTEPLSLDVDFVLEGKRRLFQEGLDVIRRLTEKEIYLCIHAHARSESLTKAQGVCVHKFDGPHPAGNISTLIHHIDPIVKGDIVWYIEAQDVLRVAKFFYEGELSFERYVAVTGESAEKRVYAKTLIGAPILSLLQETTGRDDVRYISGSVLNGKNVGKNGFLCFYDTQITVIPEGGKRSLLGWLMPGINRYTFSKTFLSAFLPQKEVSLNTDKHGGHRAIVLNHIFDELIPLDIMIYFLIRAVLAGDIDEAERLGILECDEEDFALCTFACPSKTDIGAIIRRGLEMIEKEG